MSKFKSLVMYKALDESTNLLPPNWHENWRKRKEIASGWVLVTVDKWSLQPLAQLGEVIGLRNPTERSSLRTKQMKDSDDW